MFFRRVYLSFISDCKRLLTPRRVACILAGTAILSFGMHNIHQRVGVTEGGVLGMVLLLNHWLGISPSISSLALDIMCYALAFKFLGKDFLKLSAFSSLCLAGFFGIWERLPYMLPDLSAHPLLCAVLGGAFVGVGVGLVVRQGVSSGGDDALALTISKVSGLRISLAYLFTDISVLLLSLSYIPLRQVIYSLITVTISSAIIDFVKSFRISRTNDDEADVAADDADA